MAAQPFTMPSRRRYLVVFCFAAVFYLTGWSLFNHQNAIPTIHNALSQRPGVYEANATLGFGAIVAVSKADSPRRHRLLQAANVTDIEITIPPLPKVTDEDLNKLRLPENSKMVKGSALAWLGHHNALKWFLDSGLETVLILEDDVDWDIHLRSIQAPVVAAAVRNKLQSEYQPPASWRKNQHYWGEPNRWDLLYMGHCGDYFGPLRDGDVDHHTPADLDNLPHGLAQDESLPSFGDLHPWSTKLLKQLGVPEHTRLIHRSKFPLCTFGYAVTRYAAHQLLEVLTPVKERVDSPPAYDVALLETCSRGSHLVSPPPADYVDPEKAPGLRCWTVNPELFHHTPGPSLIASIEEKSGKQVGIPPVDASGQEQVIRRNETVNIGCGFWGDGFAFDENDASKLQYLQQKVGREGQCIKTKFGNVDPPPPQQRR